MNVQNVLTLLNKQITDAQIGAEIGAPQSTVNRLRNGIHKSSSYERVQAIRILAERMGVL